MKKPWEDVDWNICETCHCEYVMWVGGDGFQCKECIEEEELERCEDE